METDTKKGRGRPNKWTAEYYRVFDDMEKRPAQNLYYASVTVHDLLHQQPGDFFLTATGRFRRQGIAEQIGRLYCTGKVTADQAQELTQAAIDQYQGGATVREVEHDIKAFRKSYLK